MGKNTVHSHLFSPLYFLHAINSGLWEVESLPVLLYKKKKKDIAKRCQTPLLLKSLPDLEILRNRSKN